jgi:hypothetical protein
MRRTLNRYRAAAALAVVIASLASPRGAAAQLGTSAATGFTFTGRGWGHGLGMSQWGAKGYADDGWSAAKVLAHYYRGTTLGSKPGPADGGNAGTIRVGLFQKSTGQRVSGNGPFEFFAAGQVVATGDPDGPLGGAHCNARKGDTQRPEFR